MNRPVEVSIICTVYNHEQYLRDCLEGLVSQKTTFPFEIVVHDDASTDGTADIIREYEKKYPELIVPIYQTENQYSQKRAIYKTFCMPKASRRFIAFCEGDDYWTDPQKLQKQYDYMQAHPDCTLCTCSTEWKDQISGKISAKGCIQADRDIPLEEIILEKKGRIFCFVSYFVRREIYDSQPVWHFPIGDYPLAVHAALNGTVHMLADSMCVYRYNSVGSWTQRMRGDEQRRIVSDKMIAGMQEIDKTTEGKYAEVIHERILTQRYVSALMSHDFSIIRNDPELFRMHKERTLLYRFTDHFRCWMPRLFHQMNRILKRED